MHSTASLPSCKIDETRCGRSAPTSCGASARRSRVPSPPRVIDGLWGDRERRESPVPFELDRVLFPKQLPFGQSRARYQTACCTRRSGKTVGELTKLLDVAREKPGSVALYITLSRINAKRIAWEILKGLNSDWKLGGIPAEGELLL